MKRRARVVLASFADGAFVRRKAAFLSEARAMALFDEILLFDAGLLPPAFLAQHGAFMTSRARGFGYWIWKPVVIQLALARARPGDLVVYLDAGFTLNAGGRERFLDYLDIALDSPYQMLSFQNIHTEYVWTKADLVHRLGAWSPSVISTSQLSSGFVVLGPTASNVELLQQWQQLAVEDGYRYSDDSPSVIANHPRFRQHRHDQSIFSLLRKLRGTAVTHYEVQAYQGYFDGQKAALPAWATRLKE